jgi:hypothetical protein
MAGKEKGIIMITKEHYDIILKELFSRVNIPYPPDHQIMVTDYEWTMEEEKSFASWLHDYLRTIPGIKRMSKRWCQREVGWFLLGYSWKYVKEEE